MRQDKDNGTKKKNKGGILLIPDPIGVCNLRASLPRWIWDQVLLAGGIYDYNTGCN